MKIYTAYEFIFFLHTPPDHLTPTSREAAEICESRMVSSTLKLFKYIQNR